MNIIKQISVPSGTDFQIEKYKEFENFVAVAHNEFTNGKLSDKDNADNFNEDADTLQINVVDENNNVESTFFIKNYNPQLL